MTCVADMDTILEETSSQTVPRTCALTDASGNFLFPNAPAGQQVVLVDGPSALYPGDLPVQTVPSACPGWGGTDL